MKVVVFILCAAALAAGVEAARPDEDYSAWKPLTDPFPSTGGNGVMIHGYRPVVEGARCSTPFVAALPGGERYRNIVEFDAVAAQGGVLCTNGRWRAEDGSASGTTPFRVFIRDGIVRGDPL